MTPEDEEHNNEEFDLSEEDEDYVPNEEAEEDKTRKKRRLDVENISNKNSKKAKNDETSSLEIAKKLRRDELWKQLNSKVGSSKAPLVSSNVSLAALCAPVKKTTIGQSKGPASFCLPGAKLPVGTEGSARGGERLSSKASVESSAPSIYLSSSSAQRSTISDEDKRAMAAAALSAAKDNASATAASSGSAAPLGALSHAKSAQGSTAQADAGSSATTNADGKSTGGEAQAATGLDAVLAELDKKKKATVLDKTRSDWRDFKAQHSAVDAELEAYKRSNDQFLDRQDFLRRAELREYEVERDQRLASDIRTRGRI